MNEKQKEYMDARMNALTPAQRYLCLQHHANRVAGFLTRAQGLLLLLSDCLGDGPTTINAQGAREILNAMGHNAQDALHAVFAISHYLTAITGAPLIKVGGRWRERPKNSKRSNFGSQHAS